MPRCAFLLLALFCCTALLHSQSPAVTLTPAVVIAGAPELIRVHAAPGAKLSGEWLRQPLEFFAGVHPGDFYALAGVDVEAPIGPSTLTIHIDGIANDITRTIDIQAAHYRTGSLTVAPKFVEPSPEAKKQIEEEAQLKKKVFAASASEPLWDGSFRAPVRTPATDSFGTRRMFNGKLASIHKGADFRAASGTPVHASNSGTVVLARPLYFEGNCVVIDHGLGLYTLSMHFSRIDVKEGQHVNTGDVLGLSGATGRVTGPHLHWAVRWHDAYLDPVKLLHMDLAAVRPGERATK
jgi:murein DD-endopeptidase MepM/ murein hydrolase activator NlpD